jgi:hypothetical protein
MLVEQLLDGGALGNVNVVGEAGTLVINKKTLHGSSP